MNEPTSITFSHNGRRYQIPTHAYDNSCRYIVLPDHTILKVLRWLESYPPIPEVMQVQTGEEVYWAGCVD